MRSAILLIFTFIFIRVNADTNEALLQKLEDAIDKKQEYTQHRLKRIETLTRQLHYIRQAGRQDEAEFEACMDLYAEYQSFVYDSALVYVEKAKQKARFLNDETRWKRAKIAEGFVLLSSGLFKESIDTLASVNPAGLPDTLKAKYYSTYARSFYDLADYNFDPLFMSKHISRGNMLLDSALCYIPENTNEYWSVESLRRMKRADWKGARFAFEYWMQNYTLSAHHYAIATSSLGYIYSLTGYPNKAIEYLAKAAIADIEVSTKETVALRNLAGILYQQGDKKRAYRYIVLALDDAEFYNARHRKIEIAAILPIIEGERLALVEGQRLKLIIYSASSTLLAILVFVFTIIIFRQVKKLRRIRQVLQDTIGSLNQTNLSLREANQIKEEYIGYFFSINSEYIEKIESLQKSIHRKITARQFDDLSELVKNIGPNAERRLLYHRFDEIFLKLFPRFIEQFNELFPPEEQITLKPGELMTPELRIFALMRLGIRDSEKMAKFLNFTVTTVYTYKTKTKSKSLYREVFDEKIMAIKAV